MNKFYLLRLLLLPNIAMYNYAPLVGGNPSDEASHVTISKSIDHDDEVHFITQLKSQDTETSPELITFYHKDWFSLMHLEPFNRQGSQDGILFEGILLHDILVHSDGDSIFFEGGQMITFYECPYENERVDATYFKNGYIKKGILKKDTEINGMVFKEKSVLALYKNGRPKSGYILKDTSLEAGELPAGSLVVFHDDGKLWYVELADDAVLYSTYYFRGQAVEIPEEIKLPSQQTVIWTH